MTRSRLEYNILFKFYERKVKPNLFFVKIVNYAYNIQHMLINNPSKTYNDTTSLLSDATIVESPYKWMLIWKKTDGFIYFDCVVFMDVYVILMIKVGSYTIIL